MLMLLNRIWVWMSSQSGQGFTDWARFLLPLGVLVLLVLWLFGTVADDVQHVANVL